MGFSITVFFLSPATEEKKKKGRTIAESGCRILITLQPPAKKSNGGNAIRVFRWKSEGKGRKRSLVEWVNAPFPFPIRL